MSTESLTSNLQIINKTELNSTEIMTAKSHIQKVENDCWDKNHGIEVENYMVGLALFVDQSGPD